MLLTRISNAIYEIKPEGQMRVPLHVCATEKILERMKDDKCIQQGMNMATLPGIKLHAVMMPDAHQGYGFPIGGVAGFDMKNGCISPGGIGYDINCLSAGTPILTEHGYFRLIENFESLWEKENLVLINFRKKHKETTSITRFFKIKPVTNILNVATKTGRDIVATEDHPFQTPRGMIRLKDLSSNSIIAIYPFKGVPFENVDDKTIISEKDIDKLNLPGNPDAIKRELRKRNLLPLKKNNPLVPYLIKLLAHNLGDGTIYFSHSKGYASFYAKLEDLKLIRNDIIKLGFKASIYKRQRKHQIQGRRKMYHFIHNETALWVRARSFVWLLYALGAPIGRKTHQDFYVPFWILKSPKWYQRLFLASLFGAELSAPATMTDNQTTFYMPTFSLSKIETHLVSGAVFIQQIQTMLRSFEIKSTSDDGKIDMIGKDGNRRIRFKLHINGDNKNLIKLFETVNFEYHIQKRLLANAAANYLRLKEMIIKKRKRIAERAFALYATCGKAKAVFDWFVPQGVNRSFLEKCIWEPRNIPTRRIPKDFPSFKEYLRVATAGLGKSGIVWDTIDSIETDYWYDGFVYDFTVHHKDHNFIANGFVVSNCSVSLLSTNLDKEDVMPRIHKLLEAIFARVPCGVGRGGAVKLSRDELDEILNTGMHWAMKKNYAAEDDRQRTEEYGFMRDADSSKISERAKARGIDQLGTLGAGNHFLEIQIVDEIYDAEIAEVFGIDHRGQICVMVHCGSRGLGHQTCTDYLRIAETHFPEITRGLVDRELAYLPAGSKEAHDYFAAMSAAANFAFVNHRVICWNVRRAFREVFDDRTALPLIYHVAHNMAKIEEFEIGKVFVHRKGATRALPAKHPNNPACYIKTGHPILIPGSMGTASYVLAGTEKAVKETFASTPHGAGRLMSRHAANKKYRAEKLKSELEHRKIFVKSASWRGITEEAPGAYKNIDEIAEASEEIGIGKRIARLTPLGVIKG